MSAQNPWWARTLRTVGIVLMSLTAAFTLLGGAGTTCVALDPTGFGGKFAGIAPFQWLYLLFVVVTLAIGGLGVRAVVLLVKARRGSYRLALLVLAAGLLVGLIHILASRVLRGASMPVDMVVYTTLITLVVFLIFRLPGLWRRLGLERPDIGSPPGGLVAAISLGLTGLLTMTVQFIMAPTHTLSGVNYADLWHATLTVLALCQWLLGGFVWARGRLQAHRFNISAQSASIP